MKRRLSLLLVALLIVMLAPSFGMAEAEPKILRYATSSLKGYFNPVLSSDVYDSYATDLIFARLASVDEGANVIFDENCVATGYELSEDHLTYTFTLKEGLVFSNGDPITANDVAFTYKMMAHPNYDGPRGPQVADMVGYEAFHSGETEDFEGIKVIDDYTISFTLKDPYVAKLLEFSDFGILSENYYKKDTYDEFKALAGTPMGAGPFIFDSYEPAQAFHAVRNPNWWGKEPKIDGVSILCIPQETQLMALISGECDVVQAPASNLDSYNTLEEGGMEIIRFIGRGYNCIMLNHQSPKLSDLNVRKALMHGFDRRSFIENEYEGFAEPCIMLVYQNPDFWAYPKDTSQLDYYEYDPELSKQLLTEAGWEINANGIWEKDGVELDLTMYIYPEAPWPEHLSALLKEQWGEIGIAFDVIVADFDTVMTDAYEKRAFDKFDMWTQGWSMSTDPDSSDLLGKVAYDTEGGFNPGGYYNERAEELFEAGRQEFDEEKRAEIYAEWALLSNQTLPMLFNAARQEIWGVAPYVTGLDRMNPFFRWVDCIYEVEIN